MNIWIVSAFDMFGKTMRLNKLINKGDIVVYICNKRTSEVDNLSALRKDIDLYTHETDNDEKLIEMVVSTVLGFMTARHGRKSRYIVVSENEHIDELIKTLDVLQDLELFRYSITKEQYFCAETLMPNKDFEGDDSPKVPVSVYPNNGLDGDIFPRVDLPIKPPMESHYDRGYDKLIQHVPLMPTSAMQTAEKTTDGIRVIRGSDSDFETVYETGRSNAQGFSLKGLFKGIGSQKQK